MRTSAESWVLAYGLNAAWQAGVVFAAAWTLARSVRQLGPGAEQRVWVAALAAQIGLPALALRAAWFRWGHGGEGMVTTTMRDGVAVGVVRSPMALLNVALGVYFAVVVVMAVRLAWGVWRTRQMVQRAEPAELGVEAQLAWEKTCAAFGVEAAVVISEDVRGPATVGVWRKVLLLPRGFVEASSAEEFAAAMAHECAHMRCYDFAKNLLYEVLLLPVAWHPAVWMTRTKLTESREMVCDAMAAEAMASGREYARALLRLASGMAGRQVRRDLMAVGIFDGNELERRMMRLSESGVEVRGVRRVVTVAACVVAGLGTCAGAATLRVSVAVPLAAAQEAGPAASGPSLARISGGVMAGNVLSRVAPQYPPDAKAKHVSGTVILRAIIGKDGGIRQLTVVSGPDELRDSALTAVRQWVYKPYLLNGQPAEVDTAITVNYTLAGPPSE